MKKLILISLVATLCLWTGTQQARAAGVPEFAVTPADGSTFFMFGTALGNYTESGGQYIAENNYVRGVVTNIGPDMWKLELTAKQAIKDVYFPWQTIRESLNGNINDDIYYYPHYLGITRKATSQVNNINLDWHWWGTTYPGTSMPLAVIADDRDARIVAATNWPPKNLTPLFGAERLVIRYDQPLAAGASSAYSALVSRVSGDASAGKVPWQLALDKYKAWLNNYMPRPTYPSWMWEQEGIVGIGIQGFPTFSISAVDNIWNAAKNRFPWLAIWGQMSPYGGGCCEPKYEMDSRYMSTNPSFPDYTKTQTANGYHVSYYQAPKWTDPETYSLDKPVGVDWLKGWINANKNYGTNAYYIDTLAKMSWGEADKVRQLFYDGTVPQESFLEGLIDIYPSAGLTSGSMIGDVNSCGAPFKRPQDYDITAFPDFARYVLGDRIIYQGAFNIDGFFLGSGYWKNYPDQPLLLQCKNDRGFDIWAYCETNGPCENASERLAFLLGAKLIVEKANGNWWDQSNPVLDAIISERQRVNWWTRRPTYYSTKDLGLSQIPPSSKVEISHFIDQSGVDLIAISNPKEVGGLNFTFNRVSYQVPAQKISILDLSSSDFVPPSAPTNLSATALSGSQISLSWAAATDNVGVAGYKIFRNGVLIGLSSQNSYVDSGLTAGTSYSYTVSAYDTAGYTSPLSNTATATTLSAQNQFAVGVKVKTTANVDVRMKAGTDRGSRIRCSQPNGSTGTLKKGPSMSEGLAWWEVNFDQSCDGWVPQNNLAVITAQ